MEQSPVNSTDADGVGNRALVVEDNQTNQAIVAAILKALDFEITFAENGVEALERVRAGLFDIILMDIHMPVMDGLEATKEIRKLGGWCGDVPIIAVTANEMVNDPAVCMEAGLSGLITKPIDSREFAQTVLSHIERLRS